MTNAQWELPWTGTPEASTCYTEPMVRQGHITALRALLLLTVFWLAGLCLLLPNRCPRARIIWATDWRDDPGFSLNLVLEGRLLLSKGSFDYEVYDCNAGSRLWRRQPHTRNSQNILAIHGSGGILEAVGNDVFRLLDSHSGDELASLVMPKSAVDWDDGDPNLSPYRHSSAVKRASYSSDASRIALMYYGEAVLLDAQLRERRRIGALPEPQTIAWAIPLKNDTLLLAVELNPQGRLEFRLDRSGELPKIIDAGCEPLAEIMDAPRYLSPDTIFVPVSLAAGSSSYLLLDGNGGLQEMGPQRQAGGGSFGSHFWYAGEDAAARLLSYDELGWTIEHVNGRSGAGSQIRLPQSIQHPMIKSVDTEAAYIVAGERLSTASSRELQSYIHKLAISLASNRNSMYREVPRMNLLNNLLLPSRPVLLRVGTDGRIRLTRLPRGIQWRMPLESNMLDGDLLAWQVRSKNSVRNRKSRTGTESRLLRLQMPQD